MGLGTSPATAIAVEVGEHPLPEPYIASAIQAVSVLLALPVSSLRDELLGDIAAGRLIAGVAWQEQGTAAANDDWRTTAIVNAENAKISGTKLWVYPGKADGWLVTCESDNHAIYWVPATTDGATATPKSRVDGSLTATLHLEDASVPAANLLGHGEAALQAIETANNNTRIVQAAELLGIARHTFNATLDYLKTRVQFGKPIGANQALQHRMVDAYLQVELATAVLKEFFTPGQDDSRTYTARCARVKARCAHAALLMTRLAIQLHGAIGYTDELDIGLYLKRALHLTSWLGGIRENRRLAFQQFWPSVRSGSKRQLYGCRKTKTGTLCPSQSSVQ